MVGNQQHGRADDGHQQAVEIESRNPGHPERVEQPSAHDCADDAKHDSPAYRDYQYGKKGGVFYTTKSGGRRYLSRTEVQHVHDEGYHIARYRAPAKK